MTGRGNGWRSAALAAVAVVWLLAPQGFAETFAACAARAYAQHIAAKQDWHRGLRDLAAKERPDLAALATLDMEHQLALVDRRQAQFSYMVRTDARRIQAGQGLSTFLNFDWTAAAARVLGQQSPGYLDLERRVDDLERQIKDQRDWSTLQEYIRKVLGVSPQFQGLLKTFQGRESAIEPLLKSCQPR